MVHPRYLKGSEIVYDVALVKLARDLKFNRIMKPVCLPEEDIDAAEKTLIIAGWGRTKRDRVVYVTHEDEGAASSPQSRCAGGHLKACAGRPANAVEPGSVVPGPMNRSPSHLETSRLTRHLQGHQGPDCYRQAAEQGPRVCTPRLTLRLYEGPATALARHSMEQKHGMVIRRFKGLLRLLHWRRTRRGLFDRRRIMRTVDTPGALPFVGDCGAGQLHGWDISELSMMNWCYRLPVLSSPSTTLVASGRAFGSAQPQKNADTGVRAPLRGHPLVSLDESVRDSPRSAAAACVIPMIETSIGCRVPFHASFTAAKLGSLHLAADYLCAAIATDFPASPKSAAVGRPSRHHRGVAAHQANHHWS
ncbi:hypothetical protein HPB52_008765 [Rhipicephalus sanguineus]|uniref:Peptidase S1 domain-containing protein n=1 Tax=Rhipicephalus sanguineus TaxID=34632 RepID=A0A9D4SPH7_RHISA|nr:hypothetical protein HPB52_008765 [Rhipicephalus sanguineus]